MTILKNRYLSLSAKTAQLFTFGPLTAVCFWLFAVSCLLLANFMPRVKWTDRKFDFSFPAGIYSEMIERLRGTPARLEERIASLPEARLRQKEGERWSIQENAGHLLDLESLVAQRLDEYIAGAAELHAADMSNRKTYDANHNEVTVESILNGFREQRMNLVDRLDELDPEIFERTAWHPRLKVPMRLVDMIFFQAEHDDFHLARISELIRMFNSGAQ